MALIFENACSMGVKSGEYGGRKSSSPPRAAMAWRLLSALWALGFVGAQMVHDHHLDHHLPWPQRRRELFCDRPRTRRRIHRPLDQPRRVQAVACQRGHQREVLP
jgi:hypothetical protein